MRLDDLLSTNANDPLPQSTKTSNQKRINPVVTGGARVSTNVLLSFVAMISGWPDGVIQPNMSLVVSWYNRIVPTSFRTEMSLWRCWEDKEECKSFVYSRVAKRILTCQITERVHFLKKYFIKKSSTAVVIMAVGVDCTGRHVLWDTKGWRWITAPGWPYQTPNQGHSKPGV